MLRGGLFVSSACVVCFVCLSFGKVCEKVSWTWACMLRAFASTLTSGHEHRGVAPLVVLLQPASCCHVCTRQAPLHLLQCVGLACVARECCWGGPCGGSSCLPACLTESCTDTHPTAATNSSGVLASYTSLLLLPGPWLHRPWSRVVVGFCLLSQDTGHQDAASVFD